MYMLHTGVQSHHAVDFHSAILYPVCVAGSSKSQVFKWPKSDSFHTWNSGKLSRRFKYSAMGIGGKSLYMLTWWLEQQFSGFTFLPCDVGKWLYNCVPSSHASYIYFPNFTTGYIIHNNYVTKRNWLCQFATYNNMTCYLE